MGKAYYCDRCGEYGHQPSRRVWDINGGMGKPVFPHARNGDYYLCESCANEFDEFMEGKS